MNREIFGFGVGGGGGPCMGVQGSAGGRGAGGRKIVKKCNFSNSPKWREIARNRVCALFGTPGTPFRGRDVLQASHMTSPKGGFVVFGGGGSPKSSESALSTSYREDFRLVSQIGTNVAPARLAR